MTMTVITTITGELERSQNWKSEEKSRPFSSQLG